MGLNLSVFTKYLDDSDTQESLKITDVDTGSSKKQENSRKTSTYYAKAFHCMDHNTVENSSRDRNTRPLDLPPEKPVCRSRSNS